MTHGLLKILLVDDEAELRRSLTSIIKSSLPHMDIQISEAENGREAFEKVKSLRFDLILMDVRMPEMSGLDALEEIKKIDPRTIVVIITAHSNVQDAIVAIRRGAFDYIEKPVQPEMVKKILDKAIETQDIVSSAAISRPILDDDVDTEFVGSSEKIAEVFELIHRLSHVDTTVLIRGENGTGKELVAKAIHYNSPRKHGTFVAINCGAIPELLMESELFGHEKGSFTDANERKIGKFQLANNGTIFLDEIAELKPEMQVKLLRVLQERKFIPIGSHREVRTNARIIAATNQNLEKMIEDGRFREDLFYRLNVMPIFMPNLRDRIEDIPGLVDYFIRRFHGLHKKPIISISEEGLQALKNYQYPGNIRELENIIERAFIVENSEQIQLSSLPENVQRALHQEVNISLPHDYVGPLDFDRFKAETEKEFITRALEHNQGKINKTVAYANIPKNTLLRKIKKYGINVRTFYD